MDVDRNVLLALLAVRTLGGQSAPAGTDALKALKKHVKAAVEKGWLKEEKLTETIPVEGKKPKKKTVPVVALTEEGERVLREAASPEALAATQGQAMAAEVTALCRSLDADREALRKSVEAALPAKGTAKEEKKFETELKGFAKELAKCATSLAALTAKMEKLEAAQPKGTDAGALLARIDEGFAALRAKVQQLPPVPAAAPSAPPEEEAPPAQQPIAPPPAPTVPESAAWGATRRAYEELDRDAERTGGIVKVPDLTDAVTQAVSGLTRDGFHELLRQWARDDKLVLQVCNDPRVEPRAAEGLVSPRGLLFYVQMR